MDLTQTGFQLGKHIRHVGRLAQITNVFARYGFWTIIDRAGIKNWLSADQVKVAEELSKSKPDAVASLNFDDQASDNPQRLRQALEELGPAFIKFGQMLASREDLLNKSYLDELKKLQKDVTPLEYEVIERVLVKELGENALRSFRFIDPQVLAAGSIGQVHRAELQDGSPVVIKVQRPQIVEQIKIDLSLMELLASLVERYVPELRKLHPVTIVQEFKNALLSELDFIREAGNTAKIKSNFSDVDYVEIPRVYWDFTTSRVLTLSYLDGVAINDKAEILKQGYDLTLIMERGLKTFLKMVFIDGLYHGDLHAGNLLVLPGSRIGLLDFGLTVRLGRHNRQHLAGLLVSLIREDYENMVSHFAELADPGPGFDYDGFEEAVANQISPFVGLKLSKVSTGALFWRLASISADFSAPLPASMILIFKTLASFEGIGAQLNPEFDVMRVCEEFSSELVEEMYSPESLQREAVVLARDLANLARYAPRQIRGLLKMVNAGELKIGVQSEEVRVVAGSLDRFASRLAISIITAALIIGSSILVFSRVGKEILHMSSLGFIGFILAGILGLYVIWSIFRGGEKF